MARMEVMSASAPTSTQTAPPSTTETAEQPPAEDPQQARPQAPSGTVVPDTENDRVLIYNSVSGAGLQANPGKYGNRCPGPPFNREDIVEVPLSDPASASVIGSFSLGQLDDGTMMDGCHDMGVILGDVNKAACAGPPRGIAVFDISDLDDPVFLEGGQGASMERHLGLEVGRNVAHVLHHLVVDALGVGHETSELLVGEQVSNHAHRELRLLVQHVGRLDLLRRLLDLVPESAWHCQQELFREDVALFDIDLPDIFDGAVAHLSIQ